MHPVGTTCAGGWAPWSGIAATMAPSVYVELTPSEMAQAERRAEAVVAMDRARDWRVKFNTGSESRMAINVRGFAAEIAAANATGLRLNWDTLLPSTYRRRDKPPDIGARVEVRNALRMNGQLWADPKERRDWLYLLLAGRGPVFKIGGWMEGAELFTGDRWMEPPLVRYPGYFAWQSDLAPLPIPGDA